MEGFLGPGTGLDGGGRSHWSLGPCGTPVGECSCSRGGCGVLGGAQSWGLGTLMYSQCLADAPAACQGCARRGPAWGRLWSGQSLHYGNARKRGS